MEGAGQPLVAFVAHDMGGAELAGNFGRAIATPIVNDQRFDDIHPSNVLGQLGQNAGQCFRLVQAGNLDDELHGMRNGECGLRNASDK